MKRIDQKQFRMDAEKIPVFPADFIADGCKGAAQMRNTIKEMGDAIDGKALKFLEFIIGLVTALVAALWALDGKGPQLLPYFVGGAILACIAAACILIFGTLTGNEWEVPGEEPDSYFWEGTADWYKAMTDSAESDADKRLAAFRAETLQKEIDFNSRTLLRMVRHYRASIWLATSAVALLAIAATVLFLTA